MQIKWENYLTFIPSHLTVFFLKQRWIPTLLRCCIFIGCYRNRYTSNVVTDKWLFNPLKFIVNWLISIIKWMSVFKCSESLFKKVGGNQNLSEVNFWWIQLLHLLLSWVKRALQRCWNSETRLWVLFCKTWSKEKDPLEQLFCLLRFGHSS